MAFPYGWKKRFTCTIDHTKVPENTPWVTVRLIASMIPASVFTNSKADGSDIRFSSDTAGATPLACEITLFSKTPNIAEIWVLVPNVSHTINTLFYLWTSNPLASAVSVTDTYGRNAVWTTASYIHVHHFQEASGTLINATGDATYNGTGSNLTYREDAEDGTYCIRFNSASNSRVALGGNCLNSGTNRTIQGWIYLNSWGGGGTGGLGRILSNESGGSGLFFKVVGNSSGHHETIAMDTVYGEEYGIALGAWYHVAVSRTLAAPGIFNFYVNGVLSGTANQSQVTPAGGNESYGCRGDGTNDRNFDGWMSEMRVSDAVQSANALLLAYNSESDPASFVSLGSETNFLGSLQIAVGGAWKETIPVNIAVGGAWKNVTGIKVASGGTWKDH